MKHKRKSPKWSIMRFRKNDHVHNLLAAATRWIRAQGGQLLVVGGISIESWPGDHPSKFYVRVGCCGRRPASKEDQ